MSRLDQARPSARDIEAPEAPAPFTRVDGATSRPSNYCVDSLAGDVERGALVSLRGERNCLAGQRERSNSEPQCQTAAQVMRGLRTAVGAPTLRPPTAIGCGDDDAGHDHQDQERATQQEDRGDGKPQDAARRFRH
jgi:hypothetical protein